MNNNLNFKQISKNFYLNEQQIIINKEQPVNPALININHIVVIDCSGSMHNELIKIRKQLKNRLPSLVKEGDTITLIYFSGRDQFGVLQQEVEIKNLKDLTEVNNAIDRFIQPIGLTGFKQPLQEVLKVIKEIKLNRTKQNPLFNLLFLTDGYDNVWQESEILTTVKELESVVSSATFIEYGYYANHNLLLKMTEVCGGKLIFSKDFNEYEPLFEKEISGKDLSNKVSVTLLNNNDYNLIFSVDNNEILTYNVNENNTLLVSDNISTLYYFSTVRGEGKEITEQIDEFNLEGRVYAAVYLFSQRLKSKEVKLLLEYLGDIKFIKQYKTCFGKQKINNFQNDIISAFNDVNNRFIEGKYDGETILKEDESISVLEFLNVLYNDNETRVFTYHPDFYYQRIGKEMVTKDTSLLNDEDKAKLLEKINNTKDPNEVKLLLEEINSSKIKPLEFTPYYKIDDEIYNKGVKINDLVFNQNRANVSILVTYNGYVDNIPEGLVPNNRIETCIFRNYTLIKDGIINVKYLPFVTSEATIEKFKYYGINLIKSDGHYLVDLEKLEIVSTNQSQDSIIFAEQIFRNYYDLLKQKAYQKVYKYFQEQHFPNVKLESWEEKYGKETTLKLKELGLTPSGGFAPKRESSTQEVNDFYYATEVNIKAAGFSAIPSVNDVLKAKASNKGLKPAQSLVNYAIEEYNNFINSQDYLNIKKDEDRQQFLKIWLTNKTRSTIEQTRKLNLEFAKIIFFLILSQTWFEEFDSIENSKLSLLIDNQNIEFTADMRDVQIEL